MELNDKIVGSSEMTRGWLQSIIKTVKNEVSSDLELELTKHYAKITIKGYNLTYIRVYKKSITLFLKRIGNAQIHSFSHVILQNLDYLTEFVQKINRILILNILKNPNIGFLI